MIKKLFITLILSVAFIGFNVNQVNAQTPVAVTWTNENVYSIYHRINSYNNSIALGTKVLSISIPYNANIVFERGAVFSQLKLKSGSTIVDTIVFEDFLFPNHIKGNFDFDLTSYDDEIDNFDIELVTALNAPLSGSAIVFMNQNTFYLELETVNKLRIHYVTDFFNIVDEILFNTIVYDWQIAEIPILPTPPNAIDTMFDNWYYADGTIFYQDAIDSSKIVDGVLNVYAKYVTFYELVYMYNLNAFATFQYIPGEIIPRFDLAIPTIAPYTDLFGRVVVCGNNVTYQTIDGTPFNFEPLSESAFQTGTYRIYMIPDCTYSSANVTSGNVDPNNPIVIFLDSIGWNNTFGLTFAYFIFIVLVTLGTYAVGVGTLAILVVQLLVTTLFMFMNFLPLFVALILLLMYTLVFIFVFKGGNMNE